MPPFAAVRTRVPELCVHTPEVPIKPEAFTAREPELTVCVPVNPAIVTVEPVGKSTLAVRITKIVSVAPARSVLRVWDVVKSSIMRLRLAYPPRCRGY